MISFNKKLSICSVILVASVFTGCDDEKVEVYHPPVTLKESPAEETIVEETSSNSGYTSNNMAIQNSIWSGVSDALTVGQAFNGWKGCKNPSWEDRTGERGESLVLFKCDLSNNNTSAYPNEILNELDHIQLAMMFSISVDGENFDAISAAKIYTFKDSKSYTEEYLYGGTCFSLAGRVPCITPRNIIQTIYKNQILKNTLFQNMYDERM